MVVENQTPGPGAGTQQGDPLRLSRSGVTLLQRRQALGQPQRQRHQLLGAQHERSLTRADVRRARQPHHELGEGGREGAVVRRR